MVAPLPQGYVVRKVTVMEDRLCIVDVEQVVSLQRYILQIDGFGI